MKIQYFSCRDFNGNLNGDILVTISDKSKEKLENLIQKIESYGYDSVNCLSEEDGIFYESFAIKANSKKDFNETYILCKK